MLSNGMIPSSGVDTGDIGHSLRFRASNSAFLSKASFNTSATATYFAAIKRGKLGAISPIFDSQIKFNANDTLTAFGLTTTAVFRDPSSWVLIVVGNGELRVNGVSLGAVTTSAITGLRIGFDGTNYFDGCIARIGVVNDQSVSYTNFVYLNSEINEWVTKSQAQVKAVVDAGGANSFMLDFDNGTSLTTLGYDKSSKGNHWTTSGISLTAGVTYDWMLDVPGSSYATLNPLDKGSGTTLTEGNLLLTTGTIETFGVNATFPITSRKYYWEVISGSGSGQSLMGIRNPNASRSIYVGGDANGYSYYQDGKKYTNNSGAAYGSSWTNTDIISVLFDADARTLEFKKNDVSQGIAFTDIPTGVWFPAFSDGSSGIGTSDYVNFGQRPFAYPPPAGFKALCQANLPDPAIKNPAKHFDIITRNGLGTGGGSITGTQFKPDFVWEKTRSVSGSNALYDSVRGVLKYLLADSTAAEGTGGLSSFDSNGFSIGSDWASGTTLVDWLWKAGGAAVANNQGSIQSQVSVNVDAGFSIVTYTGNGANATVGHGLGVVPAMIIVKDRGSAFNWAVWHKNLTGANNVIEGLNTTSAQSSQTAWNGTAAAYTPTSSVFHVYGSGNMTNNATAHVAYCFAEVPGFSKIGSYTGNGSADGPFVHCGFKPKFVMAKSASGSEAWYIVDSVRDTHNPENLGLLPNSNAAEGSGYLVDFTTTGFKIRTSAVPLNTSGSTYIFIAFADVPGKYSLAR